MRPFTSKDRTIRSDFFYILPMQIGAILFNILLNVFIARGLGPSGKGIVDYYVLLNYFVGSFGSLGIASGVLYMMTRKDTGLEEGRGVSYFFTLIGTMGVLLVLTGHLLFSQGPYQSAIILAMIAAPITIYRLFWTSILVSQNLSPLNQLFTMLTALAGMTLVGLIWWQDAISPTLVMAILMGAAYLVTSGGELALFRGREIRFSRKAIHETFVFSRRIFPGHVFNTIHFRLGQYFLAYKVGPAALGIFALATRLSELFWQLDQALISAALYKITTLEKKESLRLVLKLMALVSAVGALGLIFVYFLGEWIIVLVFGEPFRETFEPLLYLLVGAIAWSVSRIQAQYLGFRLGRAKDMTRGAFAGAALNLSLLAYLALTEKLTVVSMAQVNMASMSATFLTYAGMLVFRKYDEEEL